MNRHIIMFLIHLFVFMAKYNHYLLSDVQTETPGKLVQCKSHHLIGIIYMGFATFNNACQNSVIIGYSLIMHQVKPQTITSITYYQYFSFKHWEWINFGDGIHG